MIEVRKASLEGIILVAENSEVPKRDFSLFRKGSINYLIGEALKTLFSSTLHDGLVPLAQIGPILRSTFHIE